MSALSLPANAHSDITPGPGSSNVDELTSRTFFDVVGHDKPAVVCFHEYHNEDCQAVSTPRASQCLTLPTWTQEFRWTFEEIYEHFEKVRLCEERAVLNTERRPHQARRGQIVFGTVDQSVEKVPPRSEPLLTRWRGSRSGSISGHS